jgi:factor associated with neutral sphingomyelinase activation
MLGIQIRQPRFNLYDLDEGEMFIKEFAAVCQFVYPETEKVENLTGMILIASRSLIFEPDDQSFSIIKFHFRYLADRPRVVIIENKEMFKGVVNKIVEIPQTKVVQPFKTYEIKSDVYIHFCFEKIETVAHIIYELIDKFNSKQTVFDFDNIEYLGNLYSFKFDYTRIKSINEMFRLKQELFVKQLLPLIEVPGLIMITDSRLYFQPLFTLNTKKSISVKYSKITKLFKRRVKLREIGLEICAGNKNILLQLDNESDREMIYDLIFSYTSSTCETNISIESYTKAWTQGSMSNYEYLLALNSAANRTRNDLSQYPVFPWVLSNYEIAYLDLNDVSNFRDLSKPIGALEQKRLDAFRERYIHMPEPKFLYGTHYSNPAYVIGYLVRKHPKFMIKLHGGRFDHPDRLFNSIAIDWKVVLLI